jgi:hypothetical protein
MKLRRQLTKVRGIWSALAHGPVHVSDPEKARALLGLPKRSEDIGNLLPKSYIDRILPQLNASHKRELVRLLTGGSQLWREAWTNIVVNQGLNDLLGVTLSGTTQDTTWFVGLTSTTPTVAAGDTLASHAGWTEVTAYDEVNRVAWVDGGESGQSISNSGSPAVFTISANGTVVGGAFLAGVNTGTAGRLYAAGAFTAADKSLDDNDTLSVTCTFTTAAA